MIALAILATALTILLRGAAINVASSQRAQIMTAATELARSKMYDIEETLLEKGFGELEEDEDGDFEEEGWPQIKWKYEIVKIELPNVQAMQGFGAGEGEEGQEGQSGGMLGGLMGMAGGLGGEDGGAGAGLISSQFELFSNIMEESIRKVSLKIEYKVAGSKEGFTVDCYFTDPAAVQRVINLGPGAAEEGGDAGDNSGGGNSPTAGPSTGRSNVSGGGGLR
jgi:general secretion pathway protein I